MQPLLQRHLFFRENLLRWAATHHRPLPWKGEPDAYKIWLSEIILQQTRAAQGLPYYERFVAQFPTVRHLANAPEDEVMKLWEGLGYYSRARNLHTTAKYIAQDLNGQFPNTYAGIRALKGVGDYTAAAVASFAYALPYAVVDGNVYRVLARFFGITTPTDTTTAKKEFAALAQSLLDPAHPGAYNQAIMDFGATHCTPQQPKCPACPMRTHCKALELGIVQDLPVKAKALVKRTRHFLYAVFNYEGDIFIQKREAKDIWQQLYEFPMLELDNLPVDKTAAQSLIQQHFFAQGLPAETRFLTLSKPFRQQLTHQTVLAVFLEIQLPAALPKIFFSQPAFLLLERISRENLKKNIAVPRVIDWYIEEKAVILSLF